MKRPTVIATLICYWIIVNICYAFQDCSAPLITQIGNQSTTTVDLEWLDFNADVDSWELEYVKFGEEQTGIPGLFDLTETSVTINGLTPGTLYELYIRTICTGEFSEWNGPFNFHTNLNNDHFCELSFPLSDKNCPEQDEFIFRNELDGKLGEDLFLDAIAISIEHSWPADLQLSLQSPNGEEIELISNQGINSQHLGDPELSCNNTLIFTDRSCTSIIERDPPIRGDFKPLQPITIFYNGGEGFGNWTLKICDRASGDIGKLMQFNLIFSQGACFPPEDIGVVTAGGDFIEFEWSNTSCTELEIVYGPTDFAPDEATILYVECENEIVKIDDLSPDTEYSFLFNTVCNNFEFDALCEITVATDCATPNLVSNFDLLTVCEESCLADCVLGSELWGNISDDALDWIINSGQTGTPFTGPNDDVRQGGKYIYVDSPSNTCGTQLEALLVSSCLNIRSVPDNCDLSFSYQMNGIDVQSLVLELSIDNGESYIELWRLDGDQKEGWYNVIIDLSEYDDLVGFFRFRALSGSSEFGDIALDNIRFYNSFRVTPDQQFFFDEDNDGYGTSDVSFFSCLNTPPQGFVDNADDCDDTNPEISPAALERPCNLLDDNCNGQSDEDGDVDIDYNILDVAPTICSGINDGIIEIEAIGGQPPYTYEWSNGDNGNPVTNLNRGVYNCTISDANECKIVTEFINVSANDVLVYAIQSIQDATCNGMDDGIVNLNIGGGAEPYQYNWSNGSEEESLSAGAGVYRATITDNNGCELITDEILVRNDERINTGVLFQNDISCFSQNDGSILVTSNSGVAPYNYNWSDGETGDTRNNLAAGFYSYTVTDATGCFEALDSIQIQQPELLDVQIDRIENNVCALESDGRIETTATGGLTPYAFFWSNGEFTDDISQLPNGNYTLTITDFNGCEYVSEGINIESPQEITISIDSIRDETCQAGQDGYISITPSGGSGNYIYNWSEENNNEFFIDSIGSGIYSVTVTDDFGCKTNFSNLEVLSNDIGLDVIVEVLEDIDCNSSEGGVIRSFFFGGNPPYTFNWSTGFSGVSDQNFSSLEDLSPGSYSVTVIDNLGCEGNAEIILNPSASFNYWIDSLDHNICYGDSLGAIYIDVQGDGAPFTFSWSHGVVTQDASSLPNGFYQVTIGDNMGCPLISETVEINSPEEIIYHAETTTSSTDEPNGSIILNPTGGIQPYSLFFQDEEFLNVNFNFDDLAPGSYDFSIIDQNNCQKDTSITVETLSDVDDINIQAEIVISPNPSLGHFILYNDKANIKVNQISIYSLDGQQLEFDYNQIADGLEISTTDHPGIYFILVEFRSKSIIKKLIII